MRIQGNEITDEEAKAALEDDLLATQKYPRQDKKTRNTRWQNRENNMKNRKKEIEWNKDETRSLSPGYERATLWQRTDTS
jgi:hypothetical protein